MNLKIKNKDARGASVQSFSQRKKKIDTNHGPLQMCYYNAGNDIGLHKGPILTHHAPLKMKKGWITSNSPRQSKLWLWDAFSLNVKKKSEINIRVWAQPLTGPKKSPGAQKARKATFSSAWGTSLVQSDPDFAQTSMHVHILIYWIFICIHELRHSSFNKPDLDTCLTPEAQNWTALHCGP